MREEADARDNHDVQLAYAPFKGCNLFAGIYKAPLNSTDLKKGLEI